MQRNRSAKERGFTLIEVGIVVTIIAIMGVVAAIALTGRKNTNDLANTTTAVTALLREAESRSVTQVQGASWGIHFSNTTSTAPFYAIFYSYYSPTTTVGYYRLPSDIAYVPSTLPIGGSLDVIFSQISGTSSASTTVGFYNKSQGSLASAGISVSLSGSIYPVSVASGASPAVSSLSPNSAIAGASSFTLNVNGTNFTASSTVQWNGANRATTFVSSILLQATILAGDVATAGTANVSVWSASTGSSNSQTFTTNNLSPSLTSIGPTSATAGGSGFILTANGTNFLNGGGSTVYWNGSPLTTTYISGTQATATVSAANIATGGTFPVTVLNSAPGGGASGAQTFTVNNPTPTLTSINPSSTSAGGSGFALAVFGTNFVNGSTINWNGVATTTSYVSSSSLSATIPAAAIAAAGTVPITVTNQTPGGGTTGAQNFTINATSSGSSFNGYSYERSITVTSNTNIASGTQSNFPMLVSSTLATWEPVSKGGSATIQNLCTAPNGGQEPCDLIYSASSACTSPLNFETESYSSSTGALVDWVN
ncbi:MAG: type II secretion system protein, partial [Minisyncoccia bacterium]